MANTISLTVLVDNLAAPGLQTEHGFAAWINAGSHRILLDTGAGAALLPNAAALGIDLRQTTDIVLSHGHHDHTGALADALQAAPGARLHAAAEVSRERYSCHPGVAPRSIGMPAAARAAFNALPAAQRQIGISHRYLAPGIGLTGPIPRLADGEDAGGPFYLTPDKQQPDIIPDDQALWFETTAGLVIITGCCHAGLENTVRHIRQRSGIQRISHILGGLHLLLASTARMANTLHKLQDWAPDKLMPCHCTGDAAMQTLSASLGEQVCQPIRAGSTVVLGDLH